MTRNILTIALGIFMMLGGAMHFIQAETYMPFIPDFLPKELVNDGAGIVEILLGAGLFFPKYRPTAALGIFILMLVFLPLHTLDIFRETPEIGSKTLAYIRLPLQFVLILWAWSVRKNSNMH